MVLVDGLVVEQPTGKWRVLGSISPSGFSFLKFTKASAGGRKDPNGILTLRGGCSATELSGRAAINELPLLLQ